MKEKNSEEDPGKSHPYWNTGITIRWRIEDILRAWGGVTARVQRGEKGS